MLKEENTKQPEKKNHKKEIVPFLGDKVATPLRQIGSCPVEK